MESYRIRYGLQNYDWEEEILDFPSDNEALDYARSQALEYVGYTAEKLDLPAKNKDSSIIFGKAIYTERLCQLVLIPVDSTIPVFAATGIYPLEQAKKLLTMMGLDIPIEHDSRQSYWAKVPEDEWIEKSK